MKAFVTGVCVIGAAYSFISFFSDDKGAGKMVKFTSSVCFLISLLSLLFSLEISDVSVRIDEENQPDYALVSSQAFKMAIEDMLDKKGIKYEKITVISSENGQNGIIINEITVYGAENTAECEKIIRDNTGVERVTVYG